MSRFLILLSFLLALAAFAYVLADPTYGRVWPDYRQIAEFAVWGGRQIGWRDLIDAMSLREAGEFRPRFLMYAVQGIDVKLRLAAYPYVLVHPTVAPVAWAVQILGVALLYRLLCNLTGNRWAALAGAAIYVSSMGFLSGFTMGLQQGKAMSNTALLAALWATSEADRRLKPGDLLIAAPWRWTAVLWLVLFVGLWLDEQPIFAFALVPLVFWGRFVRWPGSILAIGRRSHGARVGEEALGSVARAPGASGGLSGVDYGAGADNVRGVQASHAPRHAFNDRQRLVLHERSQPRTIQGGLGDYRHLFRGLSVLLNGAAFTLPFVAFLLLVLLVVPRLTEYWHGYTFDYLGSTIPSDGAKYGSSLFVGRFATLTPAIIADNVTTLLGMSLAPHQTSPTIQSTFGQYPGSQVNNWPKVVTLVAFFGAALWLVWRGPLAGCLWGTLAALLLYFLFLSLLLIRHIPVATGYYYGAGFAVIWALLVGLMVASASRTPLHGDDVRPLRRETVRVGDVARRCGQDEILASRNLLGFRVACLQVLDRDPKNLLVWHLPSLLAGLCVLAIVLTQLDNFAHVHAGWQATHRDLARVYPWYRLEVPLDPDKPYEAAELRAIYAAWRAGGLDDYLAQHTVSLEAAYLVFDLRLADGPRHPGRGAGM